MERAKCKKKGRGWNKNTKLVVGRFDEASDEELIGARVEQQNPLEEAKEKPKEAVERLSGQTAHVELIAQTSLSVLECAAVEDNAARASKESGDVGIVEKAEHI